MFQSSRGTVSAPAIALVLIFGALATLYSVVTPPWESPDEVGHFSYINTLVTRHSLPLQSIGQLGEAHQPPLYYVIAAFVASPADLTDSSGAFRPNPQWMWAGQGGNEVNASLHSSGETFPYTGQALALHLARFASVLMAMATVALTIAIGRLIFPNQPAIGLLAGAIVAFNPQFLFVSGTVNNDNLLILGATGALWQTLRAARRSDEGRQWVYVGLWLGVALLAKLSGFATGAVVGAALLACAIHRRSPKIFLRGAVSIIVSVLVTCGWWFAWNQTQYGDPIGWTMYEKVFAVNLRTTPLQWGDVESFFSTQFRSSWGVFGWMNVYPAEWLFDGAKVLGLMGIIGIALFAVRKSFGQLSRFQTASLLFMFLALIVQEAYMLAIITRCNASCYQGRYIFPVIGPVMIVLSFGLTKLMPRRLVPLMAGSLVLLLAGTAVYMPFRIIGPAYVMTLPPKWTLWLEPYRTEYVFGDMLELQSHSLQTDTKASEVKLTLRWSAVRQPDFDYSVSVQMIDESDWLLAQDDHAPGQNVGYPPSKWWIGDAVIDEHVIRLPHESSPGNYRFRISVYNWSTAKALPVRFQDKAMGDFLVLAEMH